MEYGSVWKTYSENDLQTVEKFSSSYIDFISRCKTERECVVYAIELAEQNGYESLKDAIKQKRQLRDGDRLWTQSNGKALILVQIGTDPFEKGFNLLGAHVDSPRLDIKQNPLYEANDFVLFDTHYYGGIKHYQWVTLPLAIHGVVVKKTGESIRVVIGEDPDDPVFCVTDLLPHLAALQMEKKAKEAIEGEGLDLLIGSRPLVFEYDGLADSQEQNQASQKQAQTFKATGKEEEVLEKKRKAAKKEPVKAMFLKLFEERYGITEEDFLSAELEVVPAGRARDCGFDRSMVIGYGHDDRVCAYPSLRAMLAVEDPRKTTVCILVDKEEIGSVGATGMTSRFFENTMAEILELSGERSGLVLRRALAASSMLSSDVSAGFDPLYPSVFEAKNAAYLGKGIVFNKYTGVRGKSGSNDASAEYVARIRAIMDNRGVAFHTAELGKVDAGGGGTIAYIPAKYGMDVIDCGIAVLSMHSPWEVVSKADIYEAYKGYQAFLQDA